VAGAPLLLLFVLLAVARPASAAIVSDDLLGAESPRWIMLELKFGPYRPAIDDEFDGEGPYERIFGSDNFLLSALQIEFEFLKDYGTASAGVGLAFGMAKGKGLTADGTTGNDSTSLYLLPLNLSVSYHLDIFTRRWSVPLVPFVRAGFDYVVWWTTDGLGDVSDWAATRDSGTKPGYGGVWGWHVGGGLKLHLDVLAPTMAHTFDIEVGVNDSYLFAEVIHLVADDFGSGRSIRLGDTTFLFGLAFEI
jgi:hypothetical protein